jgi:hypothetical protein
VRGTQIFFIKKAIPGSIRRLRLAKLPLTNDLASALRKLRISTFNDLVGVSLRDFQRVSDKSSALLLELSRLIKVVAIGNGGSLPASRVRPNRLRNNPCSSAPHSSKRASDTRIELTPYALEILARRSPAVAQGRSLDPASGPPVASVSYPVNTASETSASPHKERIFIPQEARGRSLSSFPLSVRLQHVLRLRNLALVGDLHGRSFSEIRNYRNCGRKTLDELREFIRRIQGAHYSPIKNPPEGVVSEQEPGPVVAGRLFVPAELRHLKISHLPISVRLEGVLRQMKVRQLGELHDISVEDIRAIRNCGRKTIQEVEALLARAIRGEFSISAVALQRLSLLDLPNLIDSLIEKLSGRDKEWLLSRLGASGSIPTLEEVGQKAGVTRERVRQVVEKALGFIRKAGGPKLGHLLRKMADDCSRLVCPLTPDLFAQWTQPSNKAWQYKLAFYPRLAHELNPRIPFWPNGQEPAISRDKWTEEAILCVEDVVREAGSAIPLRRAFQTLKHGRLRRLTVQEFLFTLHHARSLVVLFPKADQPTVRLRYLRIADGAAAILGASESPMTPEDILRAAHAKFGAEIVNWSPRTMANALSPERGFYLLGPRSYGLRQHLRLTRDTQERSKADFKKLLKEENRPISSAEVVNRRRFEWSAQLSSYELACILREDEQLIDLGKFLFALAEWGIEEREYIKDLIPKILEKAGRPLTGTQVLDRLQRLRSVSPTCIASVLRTHSEVRDYGFGHYGLKSWGDSVKAEIVLDGGLIQRIIQRATPPLTFGRLAEILGVPPTGELTDKLWHTCTVSPDVLRIPEERSPGTRLIHRSCRLQRALVATAQEVNRPLPLYEFQWELNERFGMLFASKSSDDLRRALEQSSIFLRNAADEFILDIHLDQLGLDADVIRHACSEILSESKEIVGCEDLLERLEADGKSWENLSPDILASLLRDDAGFQEVGRDRFRVKSCKH